MSAADDRARERAAILQRRAKLVAYAVAAGVASAACSGKTSSVCLSLPYDGGAGGKPVTTGGSGYCLSIAGGPVVGGSGPIVGGYTVCLEPPYPCLSGGPSVGPGGAGGEPAVEGGAASVGGVAGEGGVSAEGGAPGEGGFGPSVCLTPLK